jgi:hypothetical protein
MGRENFGLCGSREISYGKRCNKGQHGKNEPVHEDIVTNTQVLIFFSKYDAEVI